MFLSLVLQKGKIPLVRRDINISENYANVCIQTLHDRILIYTMQIYIDYLAWMG